MSRGSFQEVLLALVFAKRTESGRKQNYKRPEQGGGEPGQVGEPRKVPDPLDVPAHDSSDQAPGTWLLACNSWRAFFPW